MPSRDLPPEILVMIFHIHVFLHVGSRHPLLLTCKSWYYAAVGYSPLWSRIGWGMSSNCIPGIQCRSLGDLALVVTRAGKNIHMALKEPREGSIPSEQEISSFLESVGPNWLVECRSLSVRSNVGSDSPKRILERILRHSSFPALETMEWDNHCCFRITHGHLHILYSSLFRHITSNAPRMRTLNTDLELFICSKLRSSAVFDSISSLHLDEGYSSRPIPWNLFTNLKRLGLSTFTADMEDELELDRYPYFWLQGIVAPRLSSLFLYGDLIDSYDHFPPEIAKGITHLVLKNARGMASKLPRELPALTYLGIEEHSLEPIEVEQLDELEVTINHRWSGNFNFAGSGIMPRIIRVNVHHNPLIDPDNTSGGLFTTDAVIWDRLEELHVVFLCLDGDLGPVILRSLQGDKENRVPCFPWLRCLTVRYLAAQDPETPLPTKQQRVDQLLSIMRNRVAAGLPRFTRLEVGWGWGWDVRYLPMPFDGSLDERTTEWRDCLAGIAA